MFLFRFLPLYVSVGQFFLAACLVAYSASEKKTKEERIKEENEGGIACQHFFLKKSFAFY